MQALGSWVMLYDSAKFSHRRGGNRELRGKKLDYEVVWEGDFSVSLYLGSPIKDGKF